MKKRVSSTEGGGGKATGDIWSLKYTRKSDVVPSVSLWGTWRTKTGKVALSTSQSVGMECRRESEKDMAKIKKGNNKVKEYVMFVCLFVAIYLHFIEPRFPICLRCYGVENVGM